MSAPSRPLNGDGRTGQGDTHSGPVSTRLNPVKPELDTVTAVGAIAIGAAVLAGLIGALLGGLTGMRFHRRADKAGLKSADNHAT